MMKKLWKLFERDPDAPTFIQKNGDKEWYKGSKRHRDNGLPAVVKANGNREWWVDGERHRETLPGLRRS